MAMWCPVMTTSGAVSETGLAAIPNLDGSLPNEVFGLSMLCAPPA